MSNEIDVKKLIKNFEINNDSYFKLKEYYNTPSYLEILGVDRKEVIHSQFLAWLFELGKDSQGITPIYLLIKYLFSVSKIDFTISDSEVDLVTLETEKGYKNRVDLELKVQVKNTTYTIVIENKVFAEEHNRQTDRYVAERQDNDNTLFFYLVSAPNKKANRDNYPDINKQFVIINYQGILDFVISQLSYEDQQIEFVLNEYAKSLSKSWRQYKKSNNNNHNVMALNQEHRELLNEFWNGNKDLIILALQAITEDDGFSEDVQKEVKDAVLVLKATQEKDSKKYCLIYKDQITDHFLLVDVVRQVLEFTKNDKELNHLIFEYFFDNEKYNSYPLVIKKNSTIYKRNKSRYGTKDIFFYKKQGDKTNYACLRNWGGNNIDEFKNMIKDKFSIELKQL